MQNIWSVVDMLRRNPHWKSLIIYRAYGVNVDNRMLDKILPEVDKSDKPPQLLQAVLTPFLKIGTMIDFSHSTGISPLLQIDLISLWSQNELFYSLL
jgi:hypothetical protein